MKTIHTSGNHLKYTTKNDPVPSVGQHTTTDHFTNSKWLCLTGHFRESDYGFPRIGQKAERTDEQQASEQPSCRTTNEHQRRPTSISNETRRNHRNHGNMATRRRRERTGQENRQPCFRVLRGQLSQRHNRTPFSP